MAKPSRRAGFDEVRTALRRMSAISVFVLGLTLTSPPASAPTARDPPVAATAVAFDTDPLLGPWAVEQFLAPYLVAQDFPVPPQGRPAATAIRPAADVRMVLLVRRARVAVLTLWEVVRQGSTAIRLGVLCVRRMTWMTWVSWPDDTIYQLPLPGPVADSNALPALAPNSFQDTLNYGGLGPMRGWRYLRVVRGDVGVRASATPASEAAARRAIRRRSFRTARPSIATLVAAPAGTR